MSLQFEIGQSSRTGPRARNEDAGRRGAEGKRAHAEAGARARLHRGELIGPERHDRHAALAVRCGGIAARNLKRAPFAEITPRAASRARHRDRPAIAPVR